MATPAPSWFNDATYLANKLLQLQSSDPSTGWTLAMLNAELAKYNATPYEHFLAQGDKENVSPNAYFNVSEYLKAKAVQMNGISYEGKTDWSEASVLAVMSKYGVSAWDHYLAVGQFEGINPSNALDTGAYFTAKMNLLNSVAYGGRTNWTVSDVQKIFKDAGCSPITDPSPNVAVTAVAADKQVHTSYNPYAPNVPGKTFALTVDVDTVVGTAANDTGTGTSATLQAGDTILDQSTADQDVLNLTLNAVNPAARITNIENINVAWDSFSDAAFNAANVTGSTVTLSSSKVGFLGNATVTNAGANNVVAGSGMVGNLDVSGVKTSTINAGSAKTVTVNGTAETIDSVKVLAGADTTTVTVGNTAVIETVNVTAGAKTSVVTTNAVTATIDATAAAKDAAITVKGTAGNTDVATVKIGNDAAVTTTLTGAEKLTLDVADGKVVTVATAAATADTVEVQGAGAVTVKGTATNLTLDTITKSNTGALTVAISDAAATGTINTAKFGADLITLTAGATPVIVAKTGQSFEVAASAGTSKIEVGVATDTAADALSVKLTSAAYAEVKNTAATDAETLTITAAAAQAASPTVTDLTIADLIAGADNQVIFNGTNDVALTLVTSAKTIDASALTGALTITNTAATVADLTVAGATGKNNVTFDPTALTKGAFVGQSADDTVAFGTILAAATVTAVTGDGKDTVTVDATNITSGAGGAVSIESGAGDDTVNLTSAATTTGTIALQFGDGADTLKLAAGSDVTAANLTITGLEKLVVDANANFTGAQLTGKTLTVEGTTTGAVDTITVTATAATGETINLSGLTGTDSVTTGIKGALLNGAAGKDVLIGTNRTDTIDGKADADQMTGGLGADKFVIDSDGVGTASVADVVTDFSMLALDKVSFGGAKGTALNYAEGSTAVADYAAALAAASAQITGAVQYSAQQVGADTFIFYGTVAAPPTEVVKLAGVALTDIDSSVVVA